MTEYLVPDTIEETVHLLREHNGRARIIAGGTDMLPDMQSDKHHPSSLVDVTRIPELNRIDITGGWATLGAAVTFAVLREHPYLKQHVHALVEAAASVGAAPIQTAATWAGNLIQAMPAADGAIIAIALHAEVRVLDVDDAPSGLDDAEQESPDRLWRPVASLYEGPGRSRIDSARQLVTHIRFPLPERPWGTGWRRAGRRPSLVLPTLNCAIRLVLDGDLIASAAIAVGPVGPCPVRAGDAESFLAGLPPTQSAFAEAARLALCDAHPRSNVLRASREYRLAVLPVLVEEALSQAAQRALKSSGADDSYLSGLDSFKEYPS